MPRGGRRAGSGRPRSKPAPPPRLPELPWAQIKAAAEDGAEEGDVIRDLRISEAQLADPVVLARFRDVVAAGNGRYRIDLRATIKRRGQKTTKAAGSVNALALQARNKLDWDKTIPTQEVAPDLGTARQRLRDLLVKLAQSRSEMEGKPVTVLELLHREAQADRPDTSAEGP
jgi:hypothetical protein